MIIQFIPIERRERCIGLEQRRTGPRPNGLPKLLFRKYTSGIAPARQRMPTAAFREFISRASRASLLVKIDRSARGSIRAREMLVAGSWDVYSRNHRSGTS